MPLQEGNGLASDKVYAIESYADQYVVITQEGISIFEELEDWPLPSVTNYDQGDGLSSSSINSIAVNEAGILFCGSNNGIDYADLNDDELSWQHIDESNSPLQDSYISSISCDENKTANH